MSVLSKIKNRSPTRSISTIDDYIAWTNNQFYYNGFLYGGGVQQTLAGEPAEKITNDFVSFASQLYASNGPVFALMAIRMMVFSSIRFQFQRMNNGRPSKLFGTNELRILEQPWPSGTTQDLLMKMITDADLSGNAYIVRFGDELVRLRPDWVYILLAPRKVGSSILGYRRLGYVYQEGGLNSSEEKVLLRLQDVCHFAPHPDPLASYRGMSWLTPVVRDVINDKMMQKHQTKFFENGATPNMVISLDAAVSFEEFKKFKTEFNLEHKGVDNAYKTLYIGGGADATPVGSNFEQMSFTAVQGRGETRLAAAAGIPVTIAGFSEGLQGSSLNAGNFAQARRRLADVTMHPLWANVAGSLQQIISIPSETSTRLWYDARDVPFLLEDAKDIAEIMQLEASVLSSLINQGWEPDAALDAMLAKDFSLLSGNHTGLNSVQLQPPLPNTPQEVQAANQETNPPAITP